MTCRLSRGTVKRVTRKCRVQLLCVLSMRTATLAWTTSICVPGRRPAPTECRAAARGRARWLLQLHHLHSAPSLRAAAGAGRYLAPIGCRAHFGSDRERATQRRSITCGINAKLLISSRRGERRCGRSHWRSHAVVRRLRDAHSTPISMPS